ncbi:MAG TPA: lipocalin family protein [Chthoniobacteraceae bacterium]|nr:lipocalin family protein [Chthoniobacteraceae bacterium]
MKNIRSRFLCTTLLFILAAAALRADLGVQQQSDDEVRQMLTNGSGRWNFKGLTWGWVRVFAKDGTIKTEKYSETGTWEVTNGKVVITFKSGQTNVLLLPIKVNGTHGFDAKGKPMVVSRVGEAPAFTPAPVAEATPASTAKGNAAETSGGSSGGTSVFGSQMPR